MKLVVLMSLLVFSLSTFAENKKKSDLTMSAMGNIHEAKLKASKAELKEETAEETALYAQPGQVKMSVTCKNEAGVNLKKEDKGYDDCLKNIKNEQLNKNRNPNEAEKASLNIEFGK